MSSTHHHRQHRERGKYRRTFVALIAIAWPVSVLNDLLCVQSASSVDLDPDVLLTRRGEDNASHNQYGPDVTSCSLTVLLMDPRIPFFPKDDVMYTSALESLGEYAPTDTCFVLQVTSCVMEYHLLQGHERQTAPLPGDWGAIAPDSTIEEEIRMHNRTIPTGVLQDALYQNIRERVGDIFGQRMDSGRVRVSILDYRKYKFQSCWSLGRPTFPAWFNVDYYASEFIEGIDSDQVLFFERDGALCRPLSNEDLEPWRSFAWIGGPITSWLRGPRWISKMQGWLDNVKGKTFVADWGHGEQVHRFADNFTETFPSKFVVGNGGVSLRSRKWMQRNIKTCPHKLWSGLGEAHWRESNCAMFQGDIVDDTYHSVVSKLTKAPVPTPFVASLFTIDTTMPDKVLEVAGPQTEGEQDKLIAKYWGPEGVNIYRTTLREDGHAMPLFVHKASRQKQNSEPSYYPKMMKRCKYIQDHLFERGGG